MASRFLLTVILVIVPALCAAQSWLPFGGLGDVLQKPTIPQRVPQMARQVAQGADLPIRFSDLSVVPFLARQSVGIRDQVELTNRATFPQLSVAAEIPGWFELRYLGRMKQVWDETILPPGEVRIGTTTFNKKDKDDPDAKPKPIELTWWTQSHQIEAVGRTSWPIQPYIVAHYHQFDLTGRADKIEGTERWEQWFPGIGVAFHVPFVKADIEAKAAAWKGFSTINVALRYSPIPYVSVGAEYLREDVQIGDLHHRLEGPMLSVGLTF